MSDWRIIFLTRFAHDQPWPRSESQAAARTRDSATIHFNAACCTGPTFFQIARKSYSFLTRQVRLELNRRLADGGLISCTSTHSPVPILTDNSFKISSR